MNRWQLLPYRSILLTAAAATLLQATLLCAQVVRLPTVMPPAEPYPARLVSHPEATIELLPPVDPEVEEYWDRPPDARNGFFQELFFDATWMAAGRRDVDLGETELEVKAKFAMPFPTRRHPLIIMPGFAVHYLDGPVAPDIPPRLYDTYVQFRWLHRLAPRWAVDLSVTPGVFSDFAQGTDEALRITGHFGAMWDWTPTAQLVIGAAYLDREDLRIMPFAGLIWEPRDDWELRLVVPRPRIAKRIYWHGASTENVQDWLYLAGELAGGSWAISRADGANDVATSRELRLVLGLERKILWGLDHRLELAYAFNRRVEYETSTLRIKPADTVMLRAGITY